MLIHKFTFDDYCLLVVSESADIPHDIAVSYFDTTEYDYELYDGGLSLISFINTLLNCCYVDFFIIYIDSNGDQYKKLFFSYHDIDVDNCCENMIDSSDFETELENFLIENYLKLQADIESYIQQNNIGCEVSDEGIDTSNDIVYYGYFKFYTEQDRVEFMNFMNSYAFSDSNFSVNCVYMRDINEIELLISYITDCSDVKVHFDVDWNAVSKLKPFSMDCDYFSEN